MIILKVAITYIAIFVYVTCCAIVDGSAKTGIDADTSKSVLII